MSDRSATSQQLRNSQTRASIVPTPQPDSSMPQNDNSKISPQSVIHNSSAFHALLPPSSSNPEEVPTTTEHISPLKQNDTTTHSALSTPRNPMGAPTEALSCKIEVSNLVNGVKKAQIKHYFEDFYGPVESVSLRRKETGGAIVRITFVNSALAARAVDEQQGVLFQDRPMWIQMLVKRTPPASSADKQSTPDCDKQSGQINGQVQKPSTALTIASRHAEKETRVSPRNLAQPRRSGTLHKSEDHLVQSRTFAFTFMADASQYFELKDQQRPDRKEPGSSKALSLRFPRPSMQKTPIEYFPQAQLPTIDTILKRALKAIDVCNIYAIDQTFHLLGYEIPRYADRAIVSSDDMPVAKWCVIITLDRAKLLKEYRDTADVVEELQRLFPDLLSVQRFPSLDSTQDDVLCVSFRCYKEKPFIYKYGSATFEPWLKVVSENLPVQGQVATVAGDPESFWAGNTVEKRSNKSLKVVTSFTEDWSYLAMPSQVEISISNSSSPPLLFAATARTDDNLPLAILVDGIAKLAVLCVACLQLIPKDAAMNTPGNTLCCENCFTNLLEICDVCTEPMHKSQCIELVCGCEYCSECLVHCFETATRTVSDFPPRCCDRTLSVYTHRDFLPDAVVRRYLELIEEREQRKDIHCATPTCERAIIKSYVIENDYGMCSTCLQLTCSRCEKLEKDHSLEEDIRKCPKTGDEELLELAKASNWKACPKCGTMVSRSEGCNAMQCRCGQGFCYTCGETYQNERTCSCPMTFEPRTDRANDVAEAGRPEGDNTIRVLASVVTRLILQQHRARAGNAEAVAALQGFRDSLAAQNVHVAADTGLASW